MGTHGIPTFRSDERVNAGRTTTPHKKTSTRMHEIFNKGRAIVSNARYTSGLGGGLFWARVKVERYAHLFLRFLARALFYIPVTHKNSVLFFKRNPMSMACKRVCRYFSRQIYAKANLSVVVISRHLCRCSIDLTEGRNPCHNRATTCQPTTCTLSLNHRRDWVDQTMRALTRKTVPTRPGPLSGNRGTIEADFRLRSRTCYRTAELHNTFSLELSG